MIPQQERNNFKELNISRSQLEAEGLLAKDEYLVGSLSLIGFHELERLNCSEQKLFDLDLSECRKLAELICSGEFNCNGNQLTSLDLSNNPTLTALLCQNNQLVSLELGNCSNLR